jgi:hypothetical protein
VHNESRANTNAIPAEASNKGKSYPQIHSFGHGAGSSTIVPSELKVTRNHCYRAPYVHLKAADMQPQLETLYTYIFSLFMTVFYERSAPWPHHFNFRLLSI